MSDDKKPMRVIFGALLLVGALVVAVLLYNSSSDAKGLKSAASLSCDEVAAVLDDATVAVSNAKSEVADKSGNASQADAKDTLQEAETYLTEVKERQKECDTPEDEATEAAVDCIDDHVVKLSNRGDKNRFVANGVKNRKDAKKFRQEVLDLAAVDVVVFYNHYINSPLQRDTPVKSANELVEGSKVKNGVCYSEFGVERFNEWKVLWKTTRIVATDNVKFDGVNTGVEGQQVTRSRGVLGDRSGYDIAYRGADGKVTDEYSVLNRCHNISTDEVPPVPTGETDNPPPSKETCPPGTVPYKDRCVKEPSDDGVGGNNSHASQPVGENPQGGTPGAGSEPKPNPKGPKPVDGSPAPDPTPGGYDSGSGNGSGTPGGSTCDGSGCTGGGPTGPSPGEPPVVDDGTHSGDPGGIP